MDVTFLNMETPTTFGHVASLNLFDATGPGGDNVLETTKQVFLDRIGALEPLRRRLVEVPLGLDLPYWVDDPNFDIDFHVRHHAVPPPGTPQQLSDVISRIHSRPLDRSRPLWELYVIEGIDEGRLFATFTKVHHATVDGAAGAIMLASLLDTEPEPAPVAPVRWTAEPLPTDQQLIQRTVVEYLKKPEKAIRLTTRAIRELASATQSGGLRTLASIVAQPVPGPLGAFMRRRIRGVDHEIDDPPHLPYTAAPRTPWNASIGPHRRFAYTTLSLEDARAIRRSLGCTFNDVVMALCSGVLRRYLEKHDALPKDSLIAGVPISVRTGDEADTYQNRVSMLLADLATNEPDPLQRLARVRASMNKAKTSFKAIPAETLQDFTQFAPPAVAARAMRMVSRLKIADRTAPPFNLVISNVPGPNFPLYSGGAELKHFYPVSICTDGQGLNITVQSYNGSLDFGFIVDRDLVPDVWILADLIHEEMAELLALATPQPAIRQRAAKRSAKRTVGR
jgi:WS/DGAT/MGAT family acyltransferase